MDMGAAIEPQEVPTTMIGLANLVEQEDSSTLSRGFSPLFLETRHVFLFKIELWGVREIAQR